MEITVERIKHAYESTGLTPRRWGYLTDDEQCACAIGALLYEKAGAALIHKLLDESANPTATYPMYMTLIGAELGAPPGVIAGVINGFDSSSNEIGDYSNPFKENDETYEDYLAGYTVGLHASLDLIGPEETA